MLSRCSLSLWSLAVALLFALSLGSHTAYAQISLDDFEDEEIQLRHSVHYTSSNASSESFWNNGTIADTGWLSGNTSSFMKYGKYSYSSSGQYTTNFIDRFSIKNDVEPIVEIGASANITIQGLIGHTQWGYDSACDDGENYPYQYFKPIATAVYAIDLNGNWKLVEDATVEFYPSGGREYDLVIYTGVAPLNAYKYEIDLVWHYEEFYNSNDDWFKSGDYYYNRAAGFSNCIISWLYEFPSENVAKEQLQVQKETLETEKGILETLTQLPSNLWSAFQDGLTNLFVPDADSISEIQNDWNNLLADRFGALYQVFDLILDFAAAFTESEQKTITLPEIIVPVGGDGWTFGGWEVQVVPNGMGVLFTTLKTLVSIVATFFFVNGLKRRFEGLIGGAPNA